ncbi:hypothetical protein Acsp04_66980 [Actinomadura sp. NBRC 104425]|nr:hypothetical protein Acsp04_66980 [Actinomadura sp. NBRC 104425]
MAVTSMAVTVLDGHRKARFSGVGRLDIKFRGPGGDMRRHGRKRANERFRLART